MSRYIIEYYDKEGGARIYPEYFTDEEDMEPIEHVLHILGISNVRRAVVDYRVPENLPDCDRCICNKQQSDSAEEEEEERVAREKKRAEEERVRVLWVCANEFIDYLNTHLKEARSGVSIGDGSDIVDAFRKGDWEKLHRYYNKYID